ncbi:efflux RND transporter periplasmic adaptor subunit [Emticicia soli]|uniref:Efflux RND transporter periplasmic adaptor subunit n=1 Tax=Emticicia soli TaxID=2027878 RepID=A0ABW5J3I9_9BACT
MMNKKVTNRFIKVGSTFLIMLVVFGCANSTEKVKESKKDEKYCLDGVFKKDIEFETVIKQKISEGIHLTGVIEANPDKIVTFKSLFSGIVTNTFFSIGDKVQKGQILAEVSSTEYTSLNANLQSLESQIKVAETKLKSIQGMYNDGLASRKELDEAKSELEILNVEKTKTTANRSLYSASNSKSVFQIKAPATGIITVKNISTGIQITADSDEPLFTIANLDDVWVMANIYASNIQHIKEGMEVEIRTISYPDQVFRGKVSFIPQILDESAKVLKARIVMSNKDSKLKPGMLADITALKKQEIEAASIPSSELIFSENENFVVVYRDDCDIEVRKVKILAKNQEKVYVEGLKENERVISKNQLLIFNRLNEL